MLLSCGEGLVMSGDNRGCIDRNECLDFPCLNGGTCYNKEPRLRYSCACPADYYGDNCEFVREQQHLKLSTSALASVVACLVVIISKYSKYFTYYLAVVINNLPDCKNTPLLVSLIINDILIDKI